MTGASQRGPVSRRSPGSMTSPNQLRVGGGAKASERDGAADVSHPPSICKAGRYKPLRGGQFPPVGAGLGHERRVGCRTARWVVMGTCGKSECGFIIQHSFHHGWFSSPEISGGNLCRKTAGLVG